MVKFENSRRKSLYDLYYCCGYCSGRAATELPLRHTNTRKQKVNQNKIKKLYKKKKEIICNLISGNDSNNNNHIFNQQDSSFRKVAIFLTRPSRVKGQAAVEGYFDGGSGRAVGKQGVGCSEAARNFGRARTA